MIVVWLLQDSVHSLSGGLDGVLKTCDLSSAAGIN